MRRIWIGLAALLVGLAGGSIAGCATSANAVAVCQELESARCARAEGCGIDLAYPLHSSNISDVEACQSFYDDACLHGLVTPVPTIPADVKACMNEINTGNCNAVINPQSTAACAWLNPPDAGVDASDGAVDSGTDAVTVVVAVPDATVDAGNDAAFEACVEPCESTCTDNGDCIDQCEMMCAGS